MYADLAPLAARLRGAAMGLLLFSCLFIGTLEGLFGLIAAAGVLCCAAPGSLGTAYAARCTRITATISATISLMHLMCLTMFAFAVLPEMPHAIEHACGADKMVIPADGAMPRGAIPEPTGFAHMVSAGLAARVSDAVATPASVELTPSASATFVANIATTAARRLQDVSHEAACMRTKEIFANAVPSFVFVAALVEMGLFLSAMSTAKAATRIVVAARRYGANAI